MQKSGREWLDSAIPAHQIFQAVLSIRLYILDELCRIATHNGIGGNVLGDYGTCCHNGILADGHARQDDGTHAYPGVTSNVYRFAAQHHAVLEVVVVGNDAHVGANHHTVVNGDAASRHAGQRVVHKDTTTNLHLTGEVNLKRWHQVTRLVETALEELLLQRTNLFWCGSGGVDLKTDFTIYYLISSAKVWIFCERIVI